MKPAPSNRNVPQYTWDEAVRQHDAYLRVRSQLLAIGLDDAQADEYLDAQAHLSRLVEQLDPFDEDFRSTDHTKNFQEAAAKLQRLAELLGYPLSTGN